MALQDKQVLVIGGGIAGASAALELAAQGVAVHLVERDDFIGGRAAQLACKALDACQKCNSCLAEPRLAAVLAEPRVSIHRRATVQGLNRTNGDFEVVLSLRPAYLDPGRCTGCGLCLAACPALAEGAIRRPLLAAEAPLLAIDPAACLYFTDRQSTLCRDACPEEAIDFTRQPSQERLSVQAVVLATGFAPYDPRAKERLGYGRVPEVITALELEAVLRAEGGLRRPSDGREPKKVAFIQCVGSREVAGNNYCSRVCCGYALRLGRALQARFGVEVSVFYMDLQSFGHAIDDFLQAAAGELRLVRSMPYDVYAGKDGRVLVEYQRRAGLAPEAEPFDLVVLSVGLSPNPDNQALAGLAGLGLDAHGFLAAGDAAGVFLAGAAARPMDVAEVVAHAGRAAQETIGYLEAKQS
ncbi:MAG: CoB--CoM heterodisulfide reductase iron-sulfur subunit A family protein [Desulfarculus sp.]|nr:MAG: CoB--CoM heterodisulfide reductase iron-sulfur subunit A family protein [Desulfarculus sp.]